MRESRQTTIVTMPGGERRVITEGDGVEPPDIRETSYVVRQWHPYHFWRLGGCIRLATRIDVQGFGRPIVVVLQHNDERS